MVNVTGKVTFITTLSYKRQIYHIKWNELFKSKSLVQIAFAIRVLLYVSLSQAKAMRTFLINFVEKEKLHLPCCRKLRVLICFVPPKIYSFLILAYYKQVNSINYLQAQLAGRSPQTNYISFTFQVNWSLHQKTALMI